MNPTLVPSDKQSANKLDLPYADYPEASLGNNLPCKEQEVPQKYPITSADNYMEKIAILSVLLQCYSEGNVGQILFLQYNTLD